MHMASTVTTYATAAGSTASPASIPNGVVRPDAHGGLANYVAIATAAVNRGFKVTPVHPLEKRAVLHNWNRNPTTTLSGVLQHAKDFPTHNVGVVGRRGIGNHCFLDIDADGMVERIEEPGRKMPLTYTVCSRPQTAPWKRHYYFKQTSYSVTRLRKEANRKDTTKWVTSENTGALMHPTQYDLKGVGGAVWLWQPVRFVRTVRFTPSSTTLPSWTYLTGWSIGWSRTSRHIGRSVRRKDTSTPPPPRQSRRTSEPSVRRWVMRARSIFQRLTSIYL